MDVRFVPASGLAEPLRLLEQWLRGGEPTPRAFAQRLHEEVESGRLEVIVARIEGRAVGVALLAYRLSVSVAGPFASVEDLYVVPEARRRGVGRSLLEAASERCAARGVSYVEAQVEDAEAAALYRALGYEPEPEVCVFTRSYAL